MPLSTIDELDQRRMYVTVLQTLAEVENRSPMLIARDLREANSDLLEFRIIAEPLRYGEMPLKAAPELTSGAYDALQAAARAEVSRRAHFAQGTVPTAVRRFLDAATLAGTEAGSVILRVRPPAPTQPPQQVLDGVPQPVPFERRVAERLVGAVRAAKAGSHRDPTVFDGDVLDEDIEEGLSANLCDALLELAGTGAGLQARVALRVRWALTQRADEPTTSVEVDRAELSRLPAIAEMLKQIEPEPNVTVRGPVVRFHREPGKDVGAISLQADVGGRVRTVRVELARVDYERAMAAHSRDLEVQVVGTLERAGVVRELSEPTGFEIIGGGD